MAVTRSHVADEEAQLFHIFDRPPVADGHGLVPDLGVQRFGGLLGPVFVDEAQTDRHDHDHADDDGFAALPDQE
jgi:hypothetical protein